MPHQPIFTAFPLIQALIVLMALDILMGLVTAYIAKKLSSTISWVGMSKKAATLIIVAMAVSVTPASGLPMGDLATIYYCGTEALSITEKAARLGVPLPPALLDSLVKLKEVKK